MLDIPRLETPRLVLRAHRPDDFEASYLLWSDAEVTRHIGGRPSTREEVWSRLLRYAGHWAWLGFGYWVVEDKQTGAFVGEAGLADFRRELAPPVPRVPEAGWALAPSVHGKGYATEAVAAALAWADAHLDAASTFCIIAPENRASIRVAEKCGYREAEGRTYRGEPTLCFERPRAG